MTAAFIVASIVVEFLHFLLGVWFSKRQMDRTKEHYKKIAEKMGMDPDEFFSQIENQMYGGGMNMPEGLMGNVMTTTSGGGSEHDGQGQYL